MSSTDVPAPASPIEAPKPNSAQRIIGVLIAPNETFASIARQPDWVVPLVVLLVFSVIGGIIFAQRVDFAGPVREAMEERGNMPPEAAARAVRFAVAFSKVASYGAPLFAAASYLVVAGVFLLVFRMFGGEGTFKQAFSVTVYGWMPSLIKGIIITIVVLAKSGIGAQELATVVRSNPGFLVSMKEHPMLFAALTSFDLFNIWTMILFIIGFAYMAKFSKAKSAAIVISVWIVASLFKLIGPAIRALRG
jgi:hypothetical protein